MFLSTQTLFSLSSNVSTIATSHSLISSIIQLNVHIPLSLPAVFTSQDSPFVLLPCACLREPPRPPSCLSTALHLTLPLCCCEVARGPPFPDPWLLVTACLPLPSFCLVAPCLETRLLLHPPTMPTIPLQASTLSRLRSLSPKIHRANQNTPSQPTLQNHSPLLRM